MEKIQFSTNVPVELALRFTEGKKCDSQFGDPQYMFSTTDGRTFFVSEKVAQKIHGLRLSPGELIDICKAEVQYGNGRKGIEWQISRVGSPEGEQPDGTLAVGRARAAALTTAPKTPAPAAYGNGQSTNGNGSSNGNGHASGAPEPLMPWALFLLGQTNQLIDVFALALAHASEKHGNQVRGEDVRSLLLSAFINVSKNGGGPNVA